MSGALLQNDGGVDGHAGKTNRKPGSAEGDQRAIDAPRPHHNGDGGDIAEGEPIRNPLSKDEENGAGASPLPPHSGDGDAHKPSRSRTLRARVVLAIALVFEVSSTFWAFQQATSAGALDGDVNCGDGGRLVTLYGSSLVTEICHGPIEIDVFRNYTAYWGSSFSDWDTYDGCDSLTDTLAGANEFHRLCSCSSEVGSAEGTSCSWVALSSPSDDLCFAQGVLTTRSDGTLLYVLDTYPFFNTCWATNPSGTVALTISALVIALSSQLLEAIVGFKYWKDTDKRSAMLTLAASVFESVGVVAVSWVLLSLPGFYGVSQDTSHRLPASFWLAWATIPIAVVGALLEISAEYSNRAAGRFPHLGTAGNGLIWLGAAMLEVNITSYLLWTGAGIRDVAELLREGAGLFVLELLGLVAMWVARGLWARAQLLSAPAVKRLDRSLSKNAGSARAKFERLLSKRAISGHFKL